VGPNGDYLELKRGQVKATGTVFRINESVFSIADIPEKTSIKNSAGYYMKKDMDLIDLFAGSEGTLGIITDLKLKVLDMPADIHAFMAPFGAREQAFDFIEKLKTHSHLKPLSIEFMDENSVELLMQKFIFPGGQSCLVFVEFEEAKGVMEEFTGFISGQGIDPGRVKTQSALMKEGFIYGVREALPQAVNEIMRQRGMVKISTDFSVPDGRYMELLGEYYRALEKTDVHYVVFGHAGNNNLHINFLPENKAQQEEAAAIYDALAGKAAGMAGTVSAEHGIGKLKKKYLKYMYTEEQINAMKGVKKFFDPDNLSCPGNIFD
jgi:D-lactate dehydrogenase (cytochrome)